MTRFPDVDIRQPQPFDLVDAFVRIAGNINVGDEAGHTRLSGRSGARRRSVGAALVHFGAL